MSDLDNTTGEKSQTKILALLFVGVLMGALDISIVGPAIPSIEETIRISPKDLGWIFSIYVLFNLVGIPLFAKLSDIYGRRSIYIICVTLFGIGSVMVSVADSYTGLLVARGVQGFGASGIFPVASAVIGDIFPPAKRGRALGLIGAVWGIAFIIGPVIAGTLLSYFEWHILFVVNVPIAIVLIYFSFKLLSPKGIENTSKLDVKGIVLLALTLASFTYSANHIEPDNFFGSFKSVFVFVPLISSAFFLILLILIENKAEMPIINPNLFKSKQIRMVGIIAIATGLLQASFVYIPDMVVNAFGVVPSKASFMLMPFVIATAIGSPIFGRLLDKLGSRTIIMLGIVFAVIGFGILSRVTHQYFLFYTGGVFVGLALSVLAGSALRYIMLNEVDIHQRAMTQGVITIFISMGQIIGSVVIGSIVAHYFVKALGYSQTFMFITIVMAIVLLFSLMLKSRKQEMEGTVS